MAFIQVRYRNHTRLGILVLALFAMMLACSKPETNTSVGGTGGSSDPSMAEQKPEPVAVKQVAFGEATSIFSTTATLEPEQMADVVSRSTGIVRQIAVEEGAMVKKDQILLNLEDETQQLDLKMARIKAKNLEKEYERLRLVHEKGILSSQEFEAMGNRLEEARANVEMAELSVSYTKVRAPFSGRLVHRYLDQGVNVQPGTKLFQIMDTTPLLARIHIPANRMGSVAPGQYVSLKLDNSATEIQGRLSLVSPVVDASAGTVKVTAEVPEYPEGTRPGDFVQVSVVTESHPNAMLVDTVAVFEDKGEQVLYVVNDGKAQRRVVVLGFVERGVTEVLSGIDGSDMVVVKGQRNLRDGLAVEVFEGAKDQAALANTAGEGSL